MKIIYQKKKKAAFLPIIMMTSVLFMALALAVVSMAMMNIKLANNHRDKVLALEIAEAGINYYLWHLSHDNTDYCDGVSPCVGSAEDGYGPFVHQYTDASGQNIGSFEIKVFPPEDMGSIVRIESIGRVNGRTLSRKLISELGMPSYSKYTLFVQNSELWLGPNEKINGTAFVNLSGIYNQGEITKDAYATVLEYDSVPGGEDIPGVSGDGIFGGSKVFPVPPVDFNKITTDITDVRNEALTDADSFYRDSSGSNGYHVVLHENNFDLYRVTQYYGSFSIANTNNNNDLSIRNQTFINNYEYPDSGVIFLEDHVWVDGIIDDQKITIFAADPEESRANFIKRIIINDNVKYTNYNGVDKIGLVTQSDILVRRNAPTDLEIDAAMIARSGYIMIKDYSSLIKNSIKVYGSMAHNGGLWWTYVNGWGTVVSGYRNTETTIDEANVLNPPPKFPVTGSYNILSWREE
jgi:hypothetical protein